MLLTSLVAEGLRSEGPLSVSTRSRVASLPPGPDGARVADAVALWAAALDPARAASLIGPVGGSRPTVAGAGEDLALEGLDPAGVGAALAPGARSVVVEATLSLDRTLYGRLREQAHRDPRLVTALSGDPSVAVKVGWMFSRDLRQASSALLQVRAGEVAFEVGGKDRPAWMPGLLGAMGRRLHCVDPWEPTAALAPRLLEAWLSPDPQQREGWERCRVAAAAAPFSLGEPGLVRDGSGGVELCFGPELLRLRRAGRESWDAMRWLEALWLARPDVLVLPERVPDAVRAWLDALVESDGAPVEQVWLGS